MFFKSISFLSLGLAMSAAAFGVEIRGTVVSTSQTPIADAVILHRSTGTKSVTDDKGVFRLDVPETDRIRIEVIHPDYYEREFVITKKEFGTRLILALVPLIQQREEVIVTAHRHTEPSVQIPAAGTVVESRTLAEKMSSTVTESLQSVPGVSTLGSGGFSLVPTVRGLARRRILYLVDGARIESDRRTGPNASFINTGDIERIEVLRSPSSVFYGSDAIGGVIHLMTKQPSMREGIHGLLSVGYGTNNRARNLGATIEGAKGYTGFLLSFQAVDAENYLSPLGRVPQSYFSQGSLIAKVSHRTAKREIDAEFLGARGTDMGKPLRTSDVKPTSYPRENQNLIQFRWLEKDVGGGGELRFDAFANPNFLETRKEIYDVFKTGEEFGRTESTEYGAQISFSKKLGASLRLQSGIDLFGRRRAGAANIYTSYDESGAVTEIIEERPFQQGMRKDIGFFLSVDYSGIKNLDILGGGRWDIIHQQARRAEEEDIRETTDCTGTGFFAFSYKIAKGITAFASLSRAYRVPSLNELFYTGISGRGYIVSNPDLMPETSFNLDAGFKFLGRRIYAGIYGFRYDIGDMIERYRINPTTRTYGNIEKGRIQGWEFELEYFVFPGWKVFGNAFRIKGKSVLSGNPLNDIPPLHIFAGTRIWRGRFSAEVNGVFQVRKNDPGPDEIVIPGFSVVSIKGNYHWHGLNVFVTLANLFNTAYLGRPDSDAMEEPGRNLKIGLSYTF